MTYEEKSIILDYLKDYFERYQKNDPEGYKAFVQGLYEIKEDLHRLEQLEK